MRLFSLLPPITFDHSVSHLPQLIAFGSSKVGLLVLGENGQNKPRQVLTAEQIDNSSAAALATSAEAEPNLANAAAAGNDCAASRLSGETIHDRFPFV